MLTIPKNKLLTVTDDQFAEVRKAYNATSESLSEDVDTIIKWFKLQPHLPNIDLDRGWVERIIVSNKCSIERSKKRLDMIFTSRNLMPEFFLKKNPAQLFKFAKMSMITVPLPRLPNDNTRVFLVKIMNPDSDNFDYMNLVRFFFMIFDYKRCHDYCVGDRYVYDIRNQSLGHIVKFYPHLIKKSEFILKQVYGNRISGIHILFVNPLLEKLVTLLKTVLSAKLSERIYVHQNLENLYKTIPREILPKDYGGDEKSFDELINGLEEIICSDEQVKWYDEQELLRSDESRRPTESTNFDLVGVSGSFRQLRVD